jgi:catechol 2,3-dioxygenase-like lactoylglutathione lyase family enzyme
MAVYRGRSTQTLDGREVRMIQRGRYVIAVPDLHRSSAYYHDVLDFEVLELAPGWRFFRRDNCLIMAGECPDGHPCPHSFDWFRALFGVRDHSQVLVRET